MLVLTCRNIYRKRVALRKHDASFTVTQCISYRRSLKLVQVETPPPRIVFQQPHVENSAIQESPSQLQTR